MTRQYSRPHAPNASDAGQKVAQLQHVLGLVERIAGRQAIDGALESLLDENARVSDAYNSAPPIVQRRFDSLVAETSAWATAGVEALLSAGDAAVPPRAAAGKLADDLARALSRTEALLVS